MTTELQSLADLGVFITTRDALHRVAEHVVAKARFVHDREIRLTVTDGGFGTPLLADNTRVRVDGSDLVVDTAGRSARIGLTTIADAAAFVGIIPGFPVELYPAATPFQPDQPLDVDGRAARALATWYGFTAEVLAQFASEIPEGSPSPLILWPEHFDQAFFTEDAVESRRANYGASPGDDGHAEPYLYVGPWGATDDNAFWNAATFNGAVLALGDLLGQDDPAATAMQFLRSGRANLLSPGSSQ
jgi:hypothetical protein